jgi:hypothetical protein
MPWSKVCSIYDHESQTRECESIRGFTLQTFVHFEDIVNKYELSDTLKLLQKLKN